MGCIGQSPRSPKKSKRHSRIYCLLSKRKPVGRMSATLSYAIYSLDHLSSFRCAGVQVLVCQYDENSTKIWPFSINDIKLTGLLSCDCRLVKRSIEGQDFVV